MSQVIFPTGINFLALMTSQLLQAKRAGVTAVINMQTQRRRAWQIVNETGVLPVTPVATKG